MKIRHSVKIFAGLGLMLAGLMMAAPKVYSYYQDPSGAFGAINFLNNGQTQFNVSTNSSATFSIQQTTAPLASETAIVAVSTANASANIMAVTGGGHFVINNSTAPPTTGANCAVSAGSADAAGVVVISGGATAACTITFASAFINTPVCVAADSTVTTSTVQTAPTKSQVVLTISSNRNDTIQWICIGH